MAKKTVKEVLETPIVSAIKEALRVVVISVLPIIITSIQSESFDWKLVWVTAGITLLRFIDKFLHETGRAEKNETLTRGLTQF